MANRIDENGWEWLPAVGYGPLRFGLQRDALPGDLGLQHDGDNSDISPMPEDRIEYYTVPDLDLLLAFDDRGLSTIHFFKTFRVNGREFIGLDLTVAKSYLRGLDWSHEHPTTADQLLWAKFDGFGLQLLVDGSTISSVIVSRVPD